MMIFISSFYSYLKFYDNIIYWKWNKIIKKNNKKLFA